MAFVNRYGNTISENGWRMVDAAECDWMLIPGTNVTLQIRKGVPATILAHFARRFNETIEALRDADSACWTPTNDVPTSNHMSATGMDLNWQSHPFHARGTFGDRLPRLRALLEEFRGCVWWGGDWQSPIDEMHFQLHYPEGDQRLIDLANDIRAAAPTPPVSKADQYALIIIEEGQRRGITPRGIQIALSVALVESNLRMYSNVNVPESMGIPHDAVGSDHDSLGLFQQRCPMWGPAAVLMDPAASSGLFYDRLAAMDYNDMSRSPGSFAADIQRPATQYRGRYDERFSEAVALYDRLVGTPPPPLPVEEGFLMALSDAEQRALFNAIMSQRDSRSPLRHLGEHNVGDTPDQIWDIDGSVHVLIVEMLARYGSPNDLALLQEVASANPAQYPDRQRDALIAQAILAGLNASPPMQSVQSVPPPVVYQPPPQPPAVISETNGSQPEKTTGQIIGDLYQALEALRLADALPIEARAPLAALINVLQLKNGAQV